MLSTRLAYRLARRLQDAYDAKPGTSGSGARSIFRHLLAHERAFHRARIRWLKAQTRGFTLSLPQLRNWLIARSEDLSQAVAQVQVLVQARPQAVPPLGCLLAEFQQLEDEFRELRADWEGKALAVTTERITLQQVPLGYF